MGLTGIIPVDKPPGFTSFDVVAKLRRITGTRRIGHAGTLDPAATGVLLVFLGGATRFIDLLPRQDKRYTAAFKLGIVTDTQDITGTVLEEHPVNATPDQVMETAARFVGETKQIPPMYSAVKKDGKRLYDLARQGIEVEREPRNVTFSHITFTQYDEALGIYTIDVACSKGGYIRTLCHDIGRELGCGAAMTDLRRTEACGFSLSGCHTLPELERLAGEGGIEKALLPVEAGFSLIPMLRLDERRSMLFLNGVRIRAELPPGTEGSFAVFSEHGFLGLARVEEDQLIHIRTFKQN